MTTNLPAAPTETYSPPKATQRAWIGLGVLVLPLLLIAIDGTILILALPAISADLAPSGAQQLWILDIYSFMLAGLLVTMSSVGDRFGRRKLLLVGAAAFTLASVLGAIATSPEMLIAARAALGIAGATIMPSTLSLIRNLFLDRAQRRFAMAVWGAMAAAGAAVGPLVGAWVIESFSWHAAFLINIPVMIVLLILAPILLPESRNPNLVRIDLVSALLSLLTMIPIVYAIKSFAQMKDLPVAFLALAFGLLCGSLFVRRQLRLDEPLINVRLFKIRAFSGAALGDMLSLFALVGSLYAITQYLQLVLGLGPLESALWLLPEAIIASLGGFLAAALVKRVSVAVLVSVGMLTAAAGFLLLLLATPTSGAALPAIALSLVALGAGTAMTLTNDIIMSTVPPSRAGQAAATSETAYELGTALGTAVLGSVLLSVYRSALDTNLAGLDVPMAATGAAQRTLSDALLAAEALPDTVASSFVDAAQAAFTDALVVTGGVGAAIMVFVAALGALTLRGTNANANIEVEH